MEDTRGISCIPESHRCQRCGIGIFRDATEARQHKVRYFDVTTNRRVGRLCVGCANEGVGLVEFVTMAGPKPNPLPKPPAPVAIPDDILAAYTLYRSGTVKPSDVATQYGYATRSAMREAFKRYGLAMFSKSEAARIWRKIKEI